MYPRVSSFWSIRGYVTWKGLIKPSPNRCTGHGTWTRPSKMAEGANFRPTGRADRKMSIGCVARARRVPSEFHYAHKPLGQFQAMPLVHLKRQHEHVADRESPHSSWPNTTMRIGSADINRALSNFHLISRWRRYITAWTRKLRREYIVITVYKMAHCKERGEKKCKKEKKAWLEIRVAPEKH